MEIALGSKVKDKVTGYTGIATARHEFLNGCVRYSVQGPMEKDGKLPDEKWFDIGQIDIVGPGVAKKMVAKKTGGPVSSTPPKGMRG
jgi:hypothetical protein